ncbi:MAG TPA: AAA family ATPase, partial [Nocardioides sp.]|uniref:ATP-binding protein n=1 Tax=Nocardioides sp. TaxID=35761 RepID=UPI002E36BDC9
MLLERELQLATLDEYAADARRGEGRLVLVSGEAGVGKSALVEEFERREPDAVWGWGACDGLFTPRPLGPLLDIAGQLGGPLRETIARGSTREEIFQALLGALAGSRDLTALVFEDVHWADEATLDLLRFVGKRLRTQQVLVFVTYRDDEVAPGHPLRRCLAQLSTQRSTRRVDVPRLTASAVRVLAAGSGRPADELHHLTGGNPFFLTEVLHDRGSRLPASAREAVLGRVDALTRPARRALEVASLLGSRVDLELLDAVADPSPEAVDELVDSGLLVPDGPDLRFRHEITRRAVEDGLPPHRSAPLHGRILALLRAKDVDDDARLAYHAEGASDAVAAQAHATLAAQYAAALGSHREAAAQYERALRWAGAGDDRTRALLLDGLADEYGLLDRWEDSLETRETALELWRTVGDGLREGDGVRRLSTAYWRLCRGQESDAASRQAVELLEPLGETEELARALAGEASTTAMAGDYEVSLSVADRALPMAERLGLLDVVSDVLNTIACIQQHLRRPWQEALERSLAVALDAGADSAAGRAYANLQASATASLDFSLAERIYDEGLEYCETHDMPTYVNCLLGGRVVNLEATGRFEEAVALGLGRMAAAELSPVNRLSTHFTVGKILARRGNPEAWEQLDTALADGTALGEAQYLAPIHLARAEAYWLEGDTSAAVAECRLAAATAEHVDPATRGMVDTWLARLGLEPLGLTVEAAYAVQLSGDVDEAVSTWDALGAPYDAALTLLDSPHEDHWREAVTRLDALGAEATARLARRKLREAGARGVPVGPRRTTREHSHGLTRREQEVVEELAQEQTNEEIAARLVISAKTVDHHVSSVLAKLGVANRHEAVTKARRLGLLPAQDPQSGE